MKKITPLLMTMMLSIGCAASDITPSAIEGEKIIVKTIYDKCAQAGIKTTDQLAKKHTKNEWTTVYESGRLNDEIQKICPGSKKFSDEKLKHIFMFLQKYSADSGRVPSI